MTLLNTVDGFVQHYRGCCDVGGFTNTCQHKDPSELKGCWYHEHEEAQSCYCTKPKHFQAEGNPACKFAMRYHWDLLESQRAKVEEETPHP